MKIAYSHITVDWVSVKGAEALALCFDHLQSDRPTAPLANMLNTTTVDP